MHKEDWKRVEASCTTQCGCVSIWDISLTRSGMFYSPSEISLIFLLHKEEWKRVEASYLTDVIGVGIHLTILFHFVVLKHVQDCLVPHLKYIWYF